jgi:TonB family protein
MVRNLVIALALIGGAPDAFAQRRDAVVLFNPDEIPMGHPADPGIMRPIDLSPSAQSRLPASDYPLAARRAGQTGDVVVEVRIDAGDRILDCRVTGPADSAALTAAACPLVRRRAPLVHALTNDGTPRGGTMRVRVVFDLVEPEDSEGAMVYVPPALVPVPGDKSRRPEVLDQDALVIRGAPPGLFRETGLAVNLDVDASGKVTRCSIFTSSGTDRGDMLMCRTASAARYSPGRDSRGTAIASDTIEFLSVE